MRIIEGINELKAILKEYRRTGKTIGLVPTMGYLHNGHLSLVGASRQQNDITVMSIFVNPTQFGPNEDYEKYPRDMEADSQKAEAAGVDVLFAPSVAEMYPRGYNTYVETFGITEVLCGKSRPGHFKGVCTVVLKLFNIVGPDRAYFGQKDAQQSVVIRKMASELNVPVEIIVCPIVREKDGLAMSSRNVYLSADERKAALVLSGSLNKAAAAVRDGERETEKLKDGIKEMIGGEKLADIDYVEILDGDTLEYKERLSGKMLFALAVKFGHTRLIDNIVVEVV